MHFYPYCFVLNCSHEKLNNLSRDFKELFAVSFIISQPATMFSCFWRFLSNNFRPDPEKMKDTVGWVPELTRIFHLKDLNSSRNMEREGKKNMPKTSVIKLSIVYNG